MTFCPILMPLRNNLFSSTSPAIYDISFRLLTQTGEDQLVVELGKMTSATATRIAQMVYRTIPIQVPTPRHLRALLSVPAIRFPLKTGANAPKAMDLSAKGTA